MRIVVHGQQAFGKTVLERLLERNEDVVGVFCGPDREGRPADPLKELALERDLPVHQPTSWKTDEALELMRSFDPDLCVMAYVTPRAAAGARRAQARHHPVPPSLLPKHRGPSSINWPIIQGETRTGLTIFWPDEAWTKARSCCRRRSRSGRTTRSAACISTTSSRWASTPSWRRSTWCARARRRDPTERQPGDLRELVQEGRRSDRLEQAGLRGLQPDPRDGPAARRLDSDRRPGGADLRQRATGRLDRHRAGGG